MTEASRPYRKLTERATPEHPMTPPKWELVRLVGELGMLTAEQMAGLTGRSYRAILKHARDIFDHGMVERVCLLPGTLGPAASSTIWGREDVVYKLSAAGRRRLLERGLMDREELQEVGDFGPHNDLFLAHEVGIRDVRVWLARMERAYEHDGVRLWRWGKQCQLGDCRPDALFVYDLPGAVLVGCVEVDRGTERRPETWQRKFQQYRTLLTSGLIQQVTGQKLARVIVSVPDMVRREKLADWLRELLPGSGMAANRFWIAAADELAIADFSRLIWRVPEKPDLQPMIPTEVLTEPRV